MAESPVYLTPQGLSERLAGAITVKTLETWRWKRKGPSFIKAGGAVLYRLSDVGAWEKTRLVQSREVPPQPDQK